MLEVREPTHVLLAAIIPILSGSSTGLIRLNFPPQLRTRSYIWMGSDSSRPQSCAGGTGGVVPPHVWVQSHTQERRSRPPKATPMGLSCCDFFLLSLRRIKETLLFAKHSYFYLFSPLPFSQPWEGGQTLSSLHFIKEK